MMVLQLHQLHQYRLDDDGVVACVLAGEEEQDTQTYSVYVVPAFWTDHMALGQSRRSHDSKQNLNHSVCLDPVQAVYLVGHMRRGPSHMASSVLSPVNNNHSYSHKLHLLKQTTLF
jgi:hypothetical protein